ncbi:hypothetical protein CHI11_06305 [Bacillus velezensis]|nr:hypothetical protein CHI11_06305 [Bacillus velezensis]
MFHEVSNLDINKFYFDGDLKDFIRTRRAFKNISSTKLSEMIGKNRAYISQIENGHNKNPDYETMYKIFQILGVDENDIEPQLYHFNVISPERLRYEEENFETEMDKPEEYYLAMAEEFTRRLDEEDTITKQDADSAALLREDMTNEHIKLISKRLEKMGDDPSGRGYQIIDGLDRNIRSSFNDKNLYRFLACFFNLDISRLDEKGLLRILNTLIEETNRINKEKIAFGEPKIIPYIKSLN